MPEDYLVDLEGYQKQLDAINAEFDAKIANLNSQISVLNGEIASLEGQVSSWTAKVSGAQSEVNSLTGEISDLENQLAVWRPRLDKAETFAAMDWFERIKALKDPAWQQWLMQFETSLTVEDLERYPRPHSVEDYVAIAREKVTSLSNKLGQKRNDLYAAQADLSYYKSQLSSAKIALEANTRHMRDLKLAKEAAEEERRNAIALWNAEYEAAQERKRIELDSIARDLMLGYPEMDAATAREIAETAYSYALAKGFTRVSDAVAIAGSFAAEWAETHIYPHLTTKTITCSGCGATLELTMSDIAEHNRELNCPICGVYAC